MAKGTATQKDVVANQLFWTAATPTYLYLVLSKKDENNLDELVLETQARPLKCAF